MRRSMSHLDDTRVTGEPSSSFGGNSCAVVKLRLTRLFVLGQRRCLDVQHDLIAFGPRAADRGCPSPEPGPERSLTWWAYARGRRSIALDLEAADDRTVLRRLIAGADFLVESFAPGRLAELGLDRAALEALNPTLVHVSITPFGRDGPKAAFSSTDLIAVAAAGLAHLNGEAERPPVRCSVPQAHAHAAADAAVGALIAHFERKRSGRGQHVDVAERLEAVLSWGQQRPSVLG